MPACGRMPGGRVAGHLGDLLRVWAPVWLALALTCSGIPSHAEETAPPGIGTAPRDSAMFRWWLPAGMVDDAEIESELEAIATAGFRGVEICIHMGDTGYSREQMRESGWGTPRWNAVYKNILRTANRLDLRVDTTVSPAWPAAVPTIEPGDAAASKELRAGRTAVFTGAYSGPVPLPENLPAGPFGPPPGAPAPPVGVPPEAQNVPQEQAAESNANPDVLVAVTAARVRGTRTITKVIRMAWGDMPHEAVPRTGQATLLDPKHMVTVGSYQRDPVSGEYTLDWTPPDDGEWLIFGFWMRGTGQQNKEGATTWRPNYVIDHFGEQGTGALIHFWIGTLLDDEIRQLLRANGGALFEDSLEVEYNGLPWTPTLLEDFRRLRGYDLTPYLPLFAGSRFNGMASDRLNPFELADAPGGYSDLGDRIRNDFGEALTALYIGNHIQPIQRWAQGLGLSYRAQVYGMGFDIVAAGAAALGPDGESLGFGPGVQGDDRFRMVAGAAHMARRPIVADEVGALANEGYRLTWRDMLRLINKNMTAGANRMVFHGFPYADSDVSRWPGVTPFGFGLAGYWGPRNPDWAHAADLAAYLSRTQGILQSGKPRVDLALLNLQYGTSAPVFEDQDLARAGYSYDIVSPAVLALPGTSVEGGVLASDGPGYRAMVVDSQKYMQVDTVVRLARMAEEGLKVVVVGAPPAEIPFWFDHGNQDAQLTAAMQDFLTSPNVRRVASQADVPGALRQLAVPPAVGYVSLQPLANAHRRIGQVDWFLLYNPGKEPVATRLRLLAQGPAWRLDPWTGTVVQLRDDGDAEIELSLVPEEATLLAVGNDPALARLASPATSDASRKLTLDGWQLQVESWEDAGDPGRSSTSRKTTINAGSTPLRSWRDIPVLGRAVSGIGRYTTVLRLHDWRPGIAASLNLGSIGDSSSVRLWVNGRRAAINMFSLRAEVGPLLIRGDNELVVEVASTLGNRLIEDGAITAPPWNPSARPEYEDYGLIGPVALEW